MTETDWLAWTKPQEMLKIVRRGGRATNREAALAAYLDRLKKTDEVAPAKLIAGILPEGAEYARKIDAKTTNQKVERAQESFETTWKAYEKSEANEEHVYLASLGWLMDQPKMRELDNEIDLKAELQAHLARIKKMEAIAKGRFDAGQASVMVYTTATLFRLQAEERVTKGKTFRKFMNAVPLLR